MSASCWHVHIVPGQADWATFFSTDRTTKYQVNSPFSALGAGGRRFKSSHSDSVTSTKAVGPEMGLPIGSRCAVRENRLAFIVMIRALCSRVGRGGSDRT